MATFQVGWCLVATQAGSCAKSTMRLTLGDRALCLCAKEAILLALNGRPPIFRDKIPYEDVYLHAGATQAERKDVLIFGPFGFREICDI